LENEPNVNGKRPHIGWLMVIGPGLLVAATGVGAGDLSTAAFAGNKLGVTVLWAVVVGAVMVFWGGYRLFEQIMRVCIGVMFVTVVCTAALIQSVGVRAVLGGN